MQSASLRSVEQGMKVFDRSHKEIGKVEWVQFGDDDPDTPDLEATGISEIYDNDKTLFDIFAQAFRSDELPEEVRRKLLHQGFVRIDAAGLFAADRYVTPDQIDSVSGEGLMLNVDKEQLVKH